MQSVEGETFREPLRRQRGANPEAPAEAPTQARPSGEGWSGLHALLVARLRGGTTSFHDAEDLASEALWRLFDWVRHHGPPRCLHAMALGIAHNLRRNFRRGRRRSRLVPIADVSVVLTADPASAEHVRWMIDDLLAVDGVLSPDDRSVLALLLVGLDQPRQLAALRGVGVRAAQRSLERVRAAARAWLSSR